MNIKFFLIILPFLFSGSINAQDNTADKHLKEFASKKQNEKVMQLYDSIKNQQLGFDNLIIKYNNLSDSVRINSDENILLNQSMRKLESDISSQAKHGETISREINDLNKKTLTQEKILEKIISDIESKHIILVNAIKEQSEEIKRIELISAVNKLSIEEKSKTLQRNIKATKQEADTNISRLDEDLKTNSLYWGSAVSVLFVILLAVASLLYRRIGQNKNDIETQIKRTRQSLEEEGLKLDNKLIEIFESQLKIKDEIKEKSLSIQLEEIDHSLALKVADEIVRMQKNIARMDENTKGIKPLNKGIERIRANFAANGYEMITYLNEEYEERMNINVIMFVEDEKLEEDKKIITKVIRPQVNYNGVLIQRAQVEVSQN